MKVDVTNILVSNAAIVGIGLLWFNFNQTVFYAVRDIIVKTYNEMKDPAVEPEEDDEKLGSDEDADEVPGSDEDAKVPGSDEDAEEPVSDEDTEEPVSDEDAKHPIPININVQSTVTVA